MKTTTTAKRYTDGFGKAALEVEVDGELYRGTVETPERVYVERLSPYLGHVGYVMPGRKAGVSAAVAEAMRALF